MCSIKEKIKQRELPELLRMQNGDPMKNLSDWCRRREEITQILRSQMLGYPPRISYRVTGQVVRTEEEAFGGKSVQKTIDLRITSPFSYASFPIEYVAPKGIEHPPVFLYFSFTDCIADGIGEEILDAGYAIANVYYQDIAPDYYDEHKNGLGRFCTRNPFDSWGKLAMWAWAGSRMLDYLLENERLDKNRIAVLGHSRLGKTALVCGAFDERIALTVSCGSGAAGAALFRGKTGECIENLYGQGSRLWFAGNFFAYRGQEAELPFDMHFLMALTAPRHLYVASATKDAWADPESEFLGCVAASEAYGIYELPGFVYPREFPNRQSTYHEGTIGYHIREGSHYLSRYDWQQVIAYRQKCNI